MPEFKEITENSTQIIGCTSPETAYVVGNYPYGFRLRTSIRYWIETNPKFGQRFSSQTLNPKTGRWNQPKHSTYSEVLVLTKTDSNGHVGSTGLTLYNIREKFENFSATFKLDEYQKKKFAAIKAIVSKTKGE